MGPTFEDDRDADDKPRPHRVDRHRARGTEPVGFPSYRGDIALRRSAVAETRRTFDRDFREGAVRIVRETGKPIAQVAQGKSHQTPFDADRDDTAAELADSCVSLAR